MGHPKRKFIFQPAILRGELLSPKNPLKKRRLCGKKGAPAMGETYPQMLYVGKIYLHVPLKKTPFFT